MPPFHTQSSPPPCIQVSSVVYLTDASNPTLVLEQTRGSTPAVRGWCAHPRAGAFLTFPGDFLHGVLPAPGAGLGHGVSSHGGGLGAGETGATAGGAVGAAKGGAGDAGPSPLPAEQTPPHRLTLLIAWYSARTRAEARRRRLGPAGNVPRCTRAQTWPAALAMPEGAAGCAIPVGAAGAGFHAGTGSAAAPRRLGVRECSPVWASVPPAGGGVEEVGGRGTVGRRKGHWGEGGDGVAGEAGRRGRCSRAAATPSGISNEDAARGDANGRGTAGDADPPSGISEPELSVPPALRQHFFMQAPDEVDARLYEEHGQLGTYTAVSGGAGRGRRRHR